MLYGYTSLSSIVGPAEAVVVESRIAKGLGPVSTLVIRYGTLRVNDCFVTGNTWGKVKALLDDKQQTVEEAGPTLPVEVVGLKTLTEPGEELIVVESEKRAKEICEWRTRRKLEMKEQQERGERVADFERKREKEKMKAEGRTEELAKQLEMEAEEAKKQKEKKEIAVIVRGDVGGSVEAIKSGIQLLPQDDELSVRVLSSSVGDPTENDIHLASSATHPVLLTFNVKISPAVTSLIRENVISVINHNVIYQLLEKLAEHLTKQLSPRIEVDILGAADVLKIYKIAGKRKQTITIAGCSLRTGAIARNTPVRLVRGGVLIHEGKITSLKHMKENVSEVKGAGFECGIGLQDWEDLQEGDIIESYRLREVPRKLGDPR